jgi:hypothetical protein
MIAPPSSRVIYRKLEDGHVQVRYLWCLPVELPGLTAWIGADGVRGRGEAHEYDETGQVVLSSSRGAAPPRTTPPGDEEWTLFRKLQHLTGFVSSVLNP